MSSVPLPGADESVTVADLVVVDADEVDGGARHPLHRLVRGRGTATRGRANSMLDPPAEVERARRRLAALRRSGCRSLCGLPDAVNERSTQSRWPVAVDCRWGAVHQAVERQSQRTEPDATRRVDGDDLAYVPRNVPRRDR